MSSLLRACHSHESQMAVISGWEGEGHRERVDFRFPHCGSSIEVKTCSDGLRVHHIGGSDQLEPPDGCDRGFLGSLSVVEDEYGKTCSMLLSDAKRGLLGTLDERSLASEHIDRRARTRGRSARMSLSSSGWRTSRMSSGCTPSVRSQGRPGTSR